jgi:hypothetical protein
MPVRQASSQAGFGGGGGAVDATCGCLLWHPTTAAKASKPTASMDFEKPRFFDGFVETENFALLRLFKIFSPVSSSRTEAPPRDLFPRWSDGFPPIRVYWQRGALLNVPSAHRHSDGAIYNTASASEPTKLARTGRLR